MDRNYIVIKGLSLNMFIGIHDHEKAQKQNVLVDLDIEIKGAKDGWACDDIELTLSYEVIVENIRALADRKHFNLVEHFGESICELIFSYPEAIRVVADIQKPDILENTQHVGCRLVRHKTHSF